MTIIRETTGALHGLQTFLADGTYTPTPGTKKALVYVMGGGGGGGGVIDSTSNAFGTGGGAGGTRVALFDIDDTMTGDVVVGVGGIGDSDPSAPFPPNATESTFTFNGVTATGLRGSRGDLGTGQSLLIYGLITVGAGGSGGPAGSYTHAGSPGGRGHRSTLAATMIGGRGGDSYFGAGADGFRILGTTNIGSSGQDAVANSGAGGGGAANTVDNPGDIAGGTGGSGRVVIYEYR